MFNAGRFRLAHAKIKSLCKRLLRLFADEPTYMSTNLRIKPRGYGVDMHFLLQLRVAMANGDGLRGKRFRINRDAERSSSLVHARVTLADGLLGVVLAHVSLSQLAVQALGDFWHAVLVDQWKNSGLHWRHARMEFHKHAAGTRFILGVGLA